MSSRTPGADSGTGTLAAFRLPRESVSQAGSPIRPGVGWGKSPRDSRTPGLGAARRLPAVPPASPAGWPATAPRCVPPTPTPRPREPTGIARGASLRGTKVGLPPRRPAQPGALPREPWRCGGSGRGCEPRRPSPAALPGTCWLRSPQPGRCGSAPYLQAPAAADPLSLPRSSTQPKQQPSVWRPSKHWIKNPETPDSSHLGVSSPRPLLTASLLRRRRRQQLLLEAARDRPPRLTRDRARAPGTLAQRARLSQAVPGAARPRPGERLERIVQSWARVGRGPADWSALPPPRLPGARPRALTRLELRSVRSNRWVASLPQPTSSPLCGVAVLPWDGLGSR